eukprot:1214101-Pyramimonas_sp.AAC.1
MSSRADALGRRRAGWTGPGAVVLAEGGTVWVAVRARLWKCSAEQIRLASPEEEYGLQLAEDPRWQDLLQAAQARRVTAVDVQRDG